MSAASTALGQTVPPPQALGPLNRSAVAGTKTATSSWPVPSPRDWDVGDYIAWRLAGMASPRF